MNIPAHSVRRWPITATFAAILSFCYSNAYAQQVELVDLSGNVQKGELQQFADGSVVIVENGSEKSIATSDLLRVQFASGRTAEASPPDGVQVVLTDGTSLRAQQITGDNDVWQIQGEMFLSDIALPSNAISSLQFRTLPEPAAQTWKSSQQGERVSDSIAVLRDNDLELLNGAIIAITEETVQFEFDGQTIPAPRAKLAGAIWFRRDRVDVENAATVITNNGTRLISRSLALVRDGATPVLNLVTLGGVEVKIDASKLAQIDYASANMKWLNEIESLERVATPNLSSATPISARLELLKPRFVSADLKSSTTDATTNRNLLFEGAGKIVMRAPEGYQRLEASVERAKGASVLSPINIVVRSDGKVVWSREFSGDQMRAEIEAEVVPNKQFEIAIESPSLIGFGTRTILLQPRLLR